MKQYQAVRAYKAVKKICKQDIRKSIAQKMYKISCQLKPTWDFQIEEENKIFDKYPDFDRKTGRISWKTEAERELADVHIKEIDAELSELAELETEITLTPYMFPLDQDILISAEDIEGLKGIIEFPESEEIKNGDS